MRPTTASSSSSALARSGTVSTNTTNAPLTRVRPQSASVDTAVSGLHSPLQPPPLSTDKAKQTSSDALIKELEIKVRKVVEQKRGESDRLRFAVAKKRDDVEKAKRILQDLLKDSGALGLHYDLSEHGADNHTYQNTGTTTNQQDETVGDAARLQPIASISRRPVYSKHTNIRELESKIERRATEAHLVQRRTLVLDHIKKRLQNERIEVAQTTNQLKQVFADRKHETHELQKRELAAAEAVSHVQTRLAEQRADMAASVRKFKRELALRHKWAREKAKFEKYYNDQLQAATVKAAVVRTQSSESDQHSQSLLLRGGLSPSRSTRRVTGSPPPGILKHRRSTENQQILEQRVQEEALEEQTYRAAFQRIGVDLRVDAIDPEEIVRICLSHEELRKELDAKHDESVERIAFLREQINKARSLAREDVPLSKRGTSQKIETTQLEISSLERQLVTVVDQYSFVENTVRPIKIGLQQVLQNVSSATVNVDDMASLESCLVDSCEEMMRLLRASSPRPQANDPAGVMSTEGLSGSIPEDAAVEEDDSATTLQDHGRPEAAPPQAKALPPSESDVVKPTSVSSAVVSLESFTSPFNVRISPKKQEPYFVPGLFKTNDKMNAMDHEDAEENDFDVMDRVMVKRISSVVVCTSVTRKPKLKTLDHSPF